MAKSTRVKTAAKSKAKAGPASDGDLFAREKAARELVYRSCLALDDMDFTAYLGLCHADFRYVISTYSPELRKDIVWLDHNKADMTTLLEVLPSHASDNLLRLELSRHVTAYTVDHDGDRASVKSALQVYTTTLDGGITELLGVAKYFDTIAFGTKGASLLSREVRLKTRMLGETGSHIPF
jgi:methanesulfonate monooxygenase small subunit